MIFRILNGDTINYVDNYGLRQGRWTFFGPDSLMNTGHMEFVDDVIVKIVNYHKDKSIKSIELKEKGKLSDDYNYVKYTEYFESGGLKKECLSSNADESYKAGQCKEWNENGELIYEGDYKK